MTHRLYYTQPTLAEFDASVVGDDTIDGRPAVVLDRTAFYPTSGGQPFDTGLLNDAGVVEVVERDDHSIVHVLTTPIRVGTAVHGVIDWTRRFDHMQQHTGQHILSAAFDRLHGTRTVGFHLGAEVSTLDLSRDLSAEAIASAEDAANFVVWEDRAVTVRFATVEEASALPLRKEPVREGTLRLIEVADFDLSACGGTHVSRTGEVGAIQVLGWERLRGGVRVEFVCGARALRAFRRYRDTVAGCIRVVSVSMQELPATLERMQADSKDLRKGLKAQQEEMAQYEAIALADRAMQVGERRLVVESLAGRDASALKALATAIASRPGYDAALFSADPPLLAVIARAPGAPLDAPTVLRKLVERFGGKGGGRGDVAQGGGLDGEPSRILEEARTLLAISG
ncbi:MAG: alanyl-tRNA editing protein [Bacteroidales bacterium]